MVKGQGTPEGLQPDITERTRALWQRRLAITDLDETLRVTALAYGHEPASDREARRLAPDAFATEISRWECWKEAEAVLQEKERQRLRRSLAKWIERLRGYGTKTKSKSGARTGATPKKQPIGEIREQLRKIRALAHDGEAEPVFSPIHSQLRALWEATDKRIAAIPRSREKAEGFLVAAAGGASAVNAQDYAALLYVLDRGYDLGSKVETTKEEWRLWCETEVEKARQITIHEEDGSTTTRRLKGEVPSGMIGRFWGSFDQEEGLVSTIVLSVWQELGFHNLDWYFANELDDVRSVVGTSWDSPDDELLWLVSRSPRLRERLKQCAHSIAYRLGELQQRDGSFALLEHGRVSMSGNRLATLTTARSALCMARFGQEDGARHAALWLQKHQMLVGCWGGLVLRGSDRAGTRNWAEGESILATFLAVQAMCESGAGGFSNSVKKARKWIMQQQSDLGYWEMVSGRGAIMTPAFMTVLALEALDAAEGYLHQESVSVGAKAPKPLLKLRTDSEEALLSGVTWPLTPIKFRIAKRLAEEPERYVPYWELAKVADLPGAPQEDPGDRKLSTSPWYDNLKHHVSAMRKSLKHRRRRDKSIPKELIQSKRLRGYRLNLDPSQVSIE